jgi:hypothetical protein
LDGVPYVQYDHQVPAGGTAVLTIEYYSPTRTLPQPILSARVVDPVAPSANPDGTLVSITRQIKLADGSFLIEFNSLAGRTYYVQYSANLEEWRTAVPALTGTGTSQQWIDNGPPKTESHPSTEPCRFYRIALIP